jgi:hypothetical protein
LSLQASAHHLRLLSPAGPRPPCLPLRDCQLRQAQRSCLNDPLGLSVCSLQLNPQQAPAVCRLLQSDVLAVSNQPPAGQVQMPRVLQTRPPVCVGAPKHPESSGAAQHQLSQVRQAV